MTETAKINIYCIHYMRSKKLFRRKLGFTRKKKIRKQKSKRRLRRGGTNESLSLYQRLTSPWRTKQKVHAKVNDDTPAKEEELMAKLNETEKEKEIEIEQKNEVQTEPSPISTDAKRLTRRRKQKKLRQQMRPPDYAPPPTVSIEPNVESKNPTQPPDVEPAKDEVERPAESGINLLTPMTLDDEDERPPLNLFTPKPESAHGRYIESIPGQPTGVFEPKILTPEELSVIRNKYPPMTPEIDEVELTATNIYNYVRDADVPVIIYFYSDEENKTNHCLHLFTDEQRKKMVKDFDFCGLILQHLRRAIQKASAKYYGIRLAKFSSSEEKKLNNSTFRMFTHPKYPYPKLIAMYKNKIIDFLDFSPNAIGTRFFSPKANWSRFFSPNAIETRIEEVLEQEQSIELYFGVLIQSLFLKGMNLNSYHAIIPDRNYNPRFRVEYVLSNFRYAEKLTTPLKQKDYLERLYENFKRKFHPSFIGHQTSGIVLINSFKAFYPVDKHHHPESTFAAPNYLLYH